MTVAARYEPGAALRIALAPLAAAYGAIIRVRNRRFEADSSRCARVAAPVISIGNITVGGTGKTPHVIDLVSRLLAGGRRPAVLTRGYGGSAERPADEVLEIRGAAPQARVVVDADRVRGAQRAIVEGADSLVMDDGFQHRRLGRDLDVLLVDALDPWGGGRLLPVGRLREPLDSIGRAGAVIVTRAGLAPPGAIGPILRELQRWTRPGAPILESTPKPTGLTTIDGQRIELSALRGRRVQPVAGIGAPASFVATLAAYCGEVLPIAAFRDHHPYSAADAAGIADRARRSGADMICTTRKDWMKLAPLWPSDGNRVSIVRLDIAVEMSAGDSAVLDGLVAAALREGQG